MARQQVARREPLQQGLENAPQLSPFTLSDVRSTGKKLGEGSYGTVEELEINGLICAGKKLFDALIDPVNQGAQQMMDNYYKECSLLSDLRHPNVVQFLGICFLPETRLPVLVMERLDGSLDQLLESTPDIPLHVKVSILQDVTRGLVYLHNHKPPIIHRDLTARNVLLTRAMTAKVADLGNSRKLAKSMTRGIPGTLVYMPPEALDENNKYGTSLDMFSFGHLSLFTAIQEFPEDLLPSTYRDPKTKKLTARSELERREVYVKKLHKIFDLKHAMVVLIKGCLEYDADKRPTARQALDKLAAVKTSIPPTQYSELNKVQLEMALKQKEIELKEKQNNILSATVEDQLVKSIVKRDAIIDKLKQQLKDVISELKKVQEHSKRQSQEILKLEESSVDTALKEEIEVLKLSLKRAGQQLSRSEQENEELKMKVQTSQAQAEVFKEDFEIERQDRAELAGKIESLEAKLVCGHEKLRQQEQEKQQKQLQEKQLQKQLSQVHEEVLAKSCQVKQYKKQNDRRYEELSLMDKERNELSVQVASIRRENGKLLHELEKMQKKGKKSVSSANTEGRTVFLEKKIAELEVENNTLKLKLTAFKQPAELLKPLEDAELFLKPCRKSKTGYVNLDFHAGSNKTWHDQLHEPNRLSPRQTHVSTDIHASNAPLNPYQQNTPDYVNLPSKGHESHDYVNVPSTTIPEDNMYTQPKPRAPPQKPQARPRLSLPQSRQGIMETVESRSAENTGNYTVSPHVMSNTEDKDVSRVSDPDRQHEAAELYAVPFDPNLTCPICNKMFRVGEIQMFRKHVDTCSDS